MSNETFSIGDVVVLKSGGPPMTVFSSPASRADQQVGCVWFDKDGGIQQRVFEPGTLKLCEMLS